MVIQRNIEIIKLIKEIKLRIQDAGFAFIDKNWDKKNICSPYTRIYFTYYGTGYIKQKNNIVKLRSGKVCIIPHSLIYDCECTIGMKQLFFHVTAEKPNGMDIFSDFKEIYELEIQNNDDIKILKAYNDNDFNGAIFINQILLNIMNQCLKKNSLTPSFFHGYSPKILEVFGFVKTNLSSKLTIDDICKNLFMARSTLTKLFKKEVGMSLGNYIDELLIQKIQQTLLFSDDSIGKISDYFQFCDQYYLSRYFKKRVGETPSMYRKRLKDNNNN